MDYEKLPWARCEDGFEEAFGIRAAFDKRDPTPQKNYGIHGMDLQFFLRGPKGVIQFVIYTNWHLPHVEEEMLNKEVTDTIDIKCRFLPLPAIIGCHSPVPKYEDQIPAALCPLLGRKDCYYYGSDLCAEDVFRVMVAEGRDGLSKELRKWYNMHLKGKDSN